MRKQRKARRRSTVYAARYRATRNGEFVHYLYQIARDPSASPRLRMRAGNALLGRFGLPVDGEVDALRREVQAAVRTAVRNGIDGMVRAELAALIGGRR